MLLEITLERKRDGKVETMAAGHVFDNGDQVRLRLKSHYDGFLYVMDQGTSGQFATVFPAADATLSRYGPGPAMTLRVYAHHMPTDEAKPADGLDALMG